MTERDKPKTALRITTEDVEPSLFLIGRELQFGIEDLDQIQGAIGGHYEQIPYPRQLKRPTLYILVNDNGMLQRLPYDRWGLVGDFLVVKVSKAGVLLSLSEKDIEQVTADLKESPGYCVPECGVLNQFQEMYAVLGKQPPIGTAADDGSWMNKSDQEEVKQHQESMVNSRFDDLGHQ